ncbi:M48 family metallopeptidase [Methanolobus sp. ZRKC3]|uniref:M48 family metallopeptidase n=1 Tax=Methanolobus sp. ZRKC3 TaxID=3125786 RepID=UPI003246A9A4
MDKQITIHDATIAYEVIRRNVKNPKLEYGRSKLKVIVPEKYTDPEGLIQRHRRWIYNRHSRMQSILSGAKQLELDAERCEEDFRALVHILVNTIGNEKGVKPEKVRFRKMKTKWGSCSSKGNLNFNSHMRQLPEDMIEYVVFHEMVHLIELNHSSRFWEHIRSRYPDHKEKEKQLSSYWHLLQNSF